MSAAARPIIEEEALASGPIDGLIGALRSMAGHNPQIRIPEGIEQMADADARRVIWEIATDPQVCTAEQDLSREDAAVNEARQKERNRPRIAVTDSEIHTMTALALSVLQANNTPPEIFARGAQMVRVCQDEKGGLFIQEIGEPGLTGIFDRLIAWVRFTRAGDTRPDRPPRAVIQDALALPPGEWKVPPLSGITTTPVIHPDGSIHADPGYDEATRLYYSPEDGFTLAPIPESPGEADVQKSLSLVMEVFLDFPFVDVADMANAIGALLTAVLRPCISGPVPLYLVDKPQAGSGAGLLQRTIGLIALGREPPLKTMPLGPEMRKEIFTSLRGGTSIQIFDNMEGKLSSPELAAALTAKMYTGRILGRSEEIDLEVRCFWMANGNNVQIGGDLARRTFRTRIDPQVAMPWQRDGFRHEDLEAWVLEARGRILAAIFTLARAWVRAGKPRPERVPRVGSFETWRDTIGGITEYVGVEGFLGNADEVYLEGDTDRVQWENFLSALWDWTGCNPFTAGALAKYLHSDDPGRHEIIDTLPDDLADEFGGRKSFSRVLGNAFAKQDGRHFPGGWCLRRGKIEHKVQTWAITYSPPKEGPSGCRGVSESFHNAPDRESGHKVSSDLDRGVLRGLYSIPTREEKEEYNVYMGDGEQTPSTPHQNTECRDNGANHKTKRDVCSYPRGVSKSITPLGDPRETASYSPDPSDYHRLSRLDFREKCSVCGMPGVAHREKAAEFNRRRGTSAICDRCFDRLTQAQAGAHP